jgi:fructokinase
LAGVIHFFQTEAARQPLVALGIGSFGPVDLHPASPTYGHITSTPKPGWADFDLVGAMKAAFDVPTGFDTDVDAAVLGEASWGAAQGLTDVLYLTIGTGIGGGAIVNGRMAHGLVHTEMGHVLIPHDLTRDPYPGFCPFHGDCLEGLAAGPALQARWGKDVKQFPPDHPAWQLEAHYLALALVNFALTLSPQRIILGGGVMHQHHLFPMVRREFSRLLGGYVRHPAMQEGIDSYIVPPLLGDRAGVLGALALAQREHTAAL